MKLSRRFRLCFARFVVVGVVFLAVATPVYAERDWTPQQQRVLDAIGRLSAATAPGGGGADAYAAVLADGFTRWTLGNAHTLDRP